MNRAQDALTALFGAAPVTALPPALASWTPTSTLQVHALHAGHPDIRAYTAHATDQFSADPAYFDEVAAAALNSRNVRTRAATRRTNR